MMVNVRARTMGAIVCVLLFVPAACGSSPAPVATSPSVAATTPSASAAAAGITAAQKAQVAAILNASDQHYLSLLQTGKAALGTTQYADAAAGVAAFNDPQSAASRFRDWRQSSKAEQDLTFLDAFKQADAFYNADNEPAAIGTWRDDMNQAQSDLISWVRVAVNWQISQATNGELAGAEKTFTDEMTTAQKDAIAVTAG